MNQSIVFGFIIVCRHSTDACHPLFWCYLWCLIVIGICITAVLFFISSRSLLNLLTAKEKFQDFLALVNFDGTNLTLMCWHLRENTFEHLQSWILNFYFTTPKINGDNRPGLIDSFSVPSYRTFLEGMYLRTFISVVVLLVKKSDFFYFFYCIGPSNIQYSLIKNIIRKGCNQCCCAISFLVIQCELAAQHLPRTIQQQSFIAE